MRNRHPGKESNPADDFGAGVPSPVIPDDWPALDPWPALALDDWPTFSFDWPECVPEDWPTFSFDWSPLDWGPLEI